MLLPGNGWGRLSSGSTYTLLEQQNRAFEVEPNFGSGWPNSDLWVASTVLKHRRRRLRNTEGCQILAIHRLASIGKDEAPRFPPSPSDGHPGTGTRDGLKTFMSCLALRSYDAPLHPPVKSQFLWIEDRIIPRRASFFCHVAIPCFHLENTNAHRQSDMFSAPVPFEHGEHHRKRLYIVAICLRICMS